MRTLCQYNRNCIVLYCNPPPTCHCRHGHECGRLRQPTPKIGACAAGRLIGAEGRDRQKAYVHDYRHRERAEEVHNLSLRGPLHSCAGDRGKAALRDEDASLAVNLVGTRKPKAGNAPMKKPTIQLPFATSGCACPRRWWVFWWMSRHLVTFLLVPCSLGVVLVCVGHEEIINGRCGRRGAPRSRTCVRGSGLRVQCVAFCGCVACCGCSRGHSRGKQGLGSTIDVTMGREQCFASIRQ